MSRLGPGVLVVFLSGTLAPHQSPPTPQFRSGTSLLRVDAAVVDDHGTPLTSLGADDFRVTLDGRPRKVVLARFAGAAAPDAPADQSTFALNTPAVGRAVVLMIDLESMPSGGEKTILDTAARLVDSLRPDDAAGLVPLPGTSVDLTRDRARVGAAIRRLTGVSAPWTPQYHFTYEEALSFERNDVQVKREVIARECTAWGERECPQKLTDEMRGRLARERLHVDMVLSSVAKVAAQLRTVPAPVSLMVISAGIAFEPQTLARFRDVQDAVRESGISIATVRASIESADMSARGIEAAFRADPALQSGVANLATMSGGAVYQAIGTGQGVFDRVRAELTQVYELGIQPEPGDLDGRPHEIRVAVNRPGSVRARRFITAVPARDAATGLAELIKQPMDVADLPMAVAVHSTRGDEAATLKVLVRAEIAHGVPQRPTGRYAAAIVSAENDIVTSASDAIPANGAVLVTAQLKPGRYTLRFAAIDDSGRAGVLQRPFVAGLSTVAGVQASDLIVGASADGELRPSIFAGAGGGVVPALELTAGDPERFTATSIVFELRRAGSDGVVMTAQGRLDETAYDMQRIARTTMTTAGLEAGTYIVSGQINVDGKPAARVSRTFVLEPSRAPAAAPAPPPPPAVETPAPRFPDQATETLVRKVAAYIAGYGERISGVVATEDYTQSAMRTGSPGSVSRHLRSEFALVKGSADDAWTGYRDVIEVNGVSVVEHRDRLLTILTTASSPAEGAARLADESARFNMGPVSRNFNVPTTPLFFLRGANLWRFAFTQRGTRTIGGVDTIEVAFKETAHPTLVTTRAGKDAPCKGSFWVVSADGTVVRTRVEFEGFADSLATPGNRVPIQTSTPSSAPVTVAPAGGSAGTSSGGTVVMAPTAGDDNRAGRRDRFAGIPEFEDTRLDSRAVLDVAYQRNAELGMWLPATMKEEYQGPIRWLRETSILGTANGTATYSGFKRFETATSVKVK